MPESNDRLNVAFAGGGMVSELHAAAVARSGLANLVGVFDPIPELCRKRAEDWSCTAYASLEEMLADDAVGAVFVLTSTDTHVQVASDALRAGKHVLVEKPVARSADELETLIDLAGRTDRVCMPGHNYAYIPEIARIRRLVRDGQLGEIRFVSIVFAIAHSEEVAEHYDGVVRLVLPHHAYLVNSLLGLPQRVFAGVTDTGWKTLDRDDQGWIVLEYPMTTAFLFSTLAVDDVSADPWSFVVKVLGTEGSATATWRTAVVRRAIGSMSLGFAAYEEAYEHELEAFCRAVAGDETAIASPIEDAIAVERLLRAAEQAIERRGSVDLG